MTTRPSIDERMDRWLNDEADQCEIPDEDRQRFMDHMRGTTRFAVTRAGFAWNDLIEDSRLVRFVDWLARQLRRVGNR